MCDTLRALGVRSRMSLGVVQASVSNTDTKEIADASPAACEADRSVLDIHAISRVGCGAQKRGQSEACRAFRGSLPDAGHLAVNDSLVGLAPVKACAADGAPALDISPSPGALINPSNNMKPGNIQGPLSFDNDGYFGSGRPKAASVAESDVVPCDARDGVRLELERRRIERNRKSAAKSNLKKREEREKLRKDIEQWKAKLNELKMKEDE